MKCRLMRLLQLWKDMAPRSSIRGNSLKLYPQRTRTQVRKYSFAMRVVKYWNSLPEKIVTSKTLNTFKNRLDKYWEDQDLVYEDFKAEIKLEGRDVDFNMSEEEIESGIEEPLDPALENIARYYNPPLLVTGSPTTMYIHCTNKRQKPAHIRCHLKIQ